MDRLHLALLEMRPSDSDRLQRAGFRYFCDFEGIDSSKLSHETGIAEEVAAGLLKRLREPLDSPNLLFDQQPGGGTTNSTQYIPTFCKSLDALLGGGIKVGSLTEFAGAPGTGKSQLALQAAVDCVIPEIFGGLGGSVIYIDTEGSLHPDRAKEMTNSLIHHLQRVTAARVNSRVKADMERSLRGISIGSLLNRIQVIRTLDETELVATIFSLEELVTECGDCKLIVIDSIASCLRHFNFSTKTRLLSQISLSLSGIASQFGISVITINQVTTSADMSLKPALGNQWKHSVPTRLWLSKSGDTRQITVVKNPDSEEKTIDFVISEQGCRTPANPSTSLS
eukprot:TRINITY_DN25446_c0_g1_i1.p1 TRINITY_DN25446_c0_g1~~TRINITY_DN25446_c0_g1_i1.p1  ORF type:complete len:359 (+),score=57.90 TRINITY_DN25446_c0_g1_i1:62-1078(+)